MDQLLHTDITEIINPDIVSSVLSKNPFVHVDGVFNIRDISDGSQSGLRSQYCFRSGTLENITEQGKNDLICIGIKTIYDLRSSREIASFPGCSVDGIDVVAAQTETVPLQAARYDNVCGSLYSRTFNLPPAG